MSTKEQDSQFVAERAQMQIADLTLKLEHDS
jgi:hypothetical protein